MFKKSHHWTLSWTGWIIFSTSNPMFIKSNVNIVTILVTICGIWIGDWIYWPLTGRNYKQLRQFHWVTHSKDHCNHSLLCLHQLLPGDDSQQCPLFSCSRSYRLATVSQRTPCSSCRRSTDWLSLTVLLITSRHGLHKKTPFLCCCFQLLPCTHACFWRRYSAASFTVVALQRVYMP
jgi:hypothetical protein